MIPQKCTDRCVPQYDSTLGNTYCVNCTHWMYAGPPRRNIGGNWGDQFTAQEVEALESEPLRCPACNSALTDNTAFYLCQNVKCLKAWTPIPLSQPTTLKEVPMAKPVQGLNEFEYTYDKPMKYDIDAIAAKVHERWMESQLKKGVSSRKLESGEELMVPYSELSEEAKELDRSSVQAVIEAMESL